MNKSETLGTALGRARGSDCTGGFADAPLPLGVYNAAMPVAAFDHYNLRADRPTLDRLRDFYRDVVGLTVGDRPPFRRFGYWLYSGDKAVLHLSLADDGEDRPSAINTFAHAAFNCTGRADFERRLQSLGIPYRTAQVPLLNIAQLFFHDPAGNGVELQFNASEPPSSTGRGA